MRNHASNSTSLSGSPPERAYKGTGPRRFNIESHLFSLNPNLPFLSLFTPEAVTGERVAGNTLELANRFFPLSQLDSNN